MLHGIHQLQFFKSATFLLQCREVFPLWNLQKTTFFRLRNGIDRVNHKVLFLSMLQFVIWGVLFVVTSFCVQTSPRHLRQLVWIFFTGADKSRREEEEEEGSLRLKKKKKSHFLLLSIFCYCYGWHLFLTDWLNFGGCDLLFNAVILLHSSMANIR